MPDRTSMSEKKYDIIAKLIRSDDSIIDECERNRQCFVINVGIRPNKIPIRIDLKLNHMKSPIILKVVVGPN